MPGFSARSDEAVVDGEAVDVEVARVVLGTEVVTEVTNGDTGEGAARSMLSPIANLGIAGKSVGTTTPIIGTARGGTGEAKTLPMRQATSRH